MSTQAGYISTNTPYIPGGHSVFPITMMFFPPFKHIIYLLTNCQLPEACCSSTHTHTLCCQLTSIQSHSHTHTHTHKCYYLSTTTKTHFHTNSVCPLKNYCPFTHTVTRHTHTVVNSTSTLSLSHCTSHCIFNHRLLSHSHVLRLQTLIITQPLRVSIHTLTHTQTNTQYLFTQTLRASTHRLFH